MERGASISSSRCWVLGVAELFIHDPPPGRDAQDVQAQIQFACILEGANKTTAQAPSAHPEQMLCPRGYSAATDAAASSGRRRPSVKEALMAHFNGNIETASDDIDDRAPKWGAVLAFMLVYVVSYIDRQVLTIV